MTGSLTVKNGKYYAILNVYENGKRKKNGSVPIFPKRETSEEPNNSCEKCWRNMNVWKVL